MKTVKAILNMDMTLKKEAMAKARTEGWTLSAFFNFAAREYVAGNLRMTVLDREIEEARQDIREGKYITQEELKKRIYGKDLRKSHR